jgi:DNA-binding Lrp family transcriptional regulator
MSRAELSATDELLVELLQKNARTTNKELARAAGIAESTCLDRVRALQDRGVIRGWHAEVDLPSIGRSLRALIHVALKPKTTQSVQDFLERMLEAPETVSVSMVTGAHDFVVEVAVPDVDRLRNFVLETITSRPDAMDTQSSLVYEHQRKHVLAPLPDSP